MGWSVLFIVLVAGRARAEERAAPALNYVRASGAERCIDPSALSARVEAVTETALVSSSQTTQVLEVLMEPEGSGFRAIIALGGRAARRDQRVLRDASSDCHKLDAPLVFVLSLMVDPTLATRALPPELKAMLTDQDLAPENALLAELERAPPVPVIASPAPPEEQRPSVTPKAAPRKPRARYVLGAGAALSWLALPDTAWGFGAGLASDFARSFWLTLDMHAHPFGVARSLPGGERMTLRAYDLTLGLCPLYGASGSMFAMLCAGPSLDVLSAQGYGFDRDHRALLWMPSMFLGATVRAKLFGRFGALLELRGRVRLTSPTFVSVPTDEVHERAYAPGRFALSLVFGAYVEI